MMKSVSMRDIGRALGCSAVTVSKALGGKDGVSESVRAQIVKKAKEMGYRYPQAAKPAPRGRDIGVVIADCFFGENAFYASLYKKLVQRLTKEGCYAILEILTQKAERELTLPAMVRAGRVSGLIVLGQLSSEYLASLEQSGLPTVFLDFYDEQLSQEAVVSDSVYGAYCLTRRLIEQGHTQIGFVGEVRATSSIMDRYLGYYRAMLSQSLPIREEWIIPDREGRSKSISLRLPDTLPTAFVCNCDSVASQLISALEARGLNVPKDVSVAGFDDYLEATMRTPALTTFRVDQDGMVKAAAEMILGKLEGKRRPRGRLVIGGEMVERESTRDIRKPQANLG